ncbi:MAG: patatin-like phospholipase family protein [Chloroflexia bacterium]|nr:patatin-like phospholipase family protein [Chloroflexia bacterium]
MVESNSTLEFWPQRALVLSGGGGRGAFQCGVLEKLGEVGWEPDVLVGTSIGSMNAAVWALDGTPGVVRMWENIRTRDMHRFWRLRPWRSLFDRRAWKKTLETYAPEERLREIDTALYIVATDIDTGHPVIFTNAVDLNGNKPLYRRVEAINHRHLLASSSIPYVYAKTRVGDSDYWDGAVMYNSPLRPAIDAGAEEILVVLLSPYHDILDPGQQLPPPAPGPAGKVGHLLDLAITATFENDFEQMRKINRRVSQNADPAHKEIKAALIGPEQWLTALDFIRYHPERTAELRRLGQEAAATTWQRVQEEGWDSLHW